MTKNSSYFWQVKAMVFHFLAVITVHVKVIIVNVLTTVNAMVIIANVAVKIQMMKIPTLQNMFVHNLF